MTAIGQRTAQVQGRRARHKRRRIVEGSAPTRVITVAVQVVAAVYFLVPLYWLIIASTKSTSDLYGSFGLWLAHPQFVQNIRGLFSYQNHIYLRWLGNSVLYSGVGAAAATLIAAYAGYALAKYQFRGREAAFKVILGGVMIPGTALALPLYLLISRVGLTNSYWSVLLPQIVTPFGVYLCRIYAESAVPEDIIEAARADGASEFRIFHSIVFRLMTPAVVTIFLFQFVGIWNNFFLPLVMLSNQNLYPITLGLTVWQGFESRLPLLYQYVVGGALVSVVPLVILILVLQRYWRGGLTEGSVRT
jgi:multiple sugar transport system permease protein